MAKKSSKKKKSDIKQALQTVQIQDLIDRNIGNVFDDVSGMLLSFYKQANTLTICVSSTKFDRTMKKSEIMKIFPTSPEYYLSGALLKSCFGVGEIHQAIFSCIANKNNEIKQLIEQYGRHSVLQAGGLEIIKYMKNNGIKPVKRLKSILTEDVILEAFTHNSSFSQSARGALKRLIVIRKLTDDFLASVPDNYAMLYPEARAIKRHVHIHVGPTNSGKTYDAIQRLMRASNGVYLAPLRLLAYEKYEEMTTAGVKCSMITGEQVITHLDDTHQSSTIEMLDLTREYEVAVIDEAQMVADKDRGGAWTAAILGVVAHEVHICTSPEALDVINKLITSCGDETTITHHNRLTPLEPEKKPFVYPDDIQDGDALIVFSRKDAHACASDLAEHGISCSLIYGALPYDVRHAEAEKFAKGITKTVVSTDAIGMGMNLPIKRIVFLRTEKFDGIETRALQPCEVRQIAGRAGRYGKYQKGYYTSAVNFSGIKKLMSADIINIDKAVINIPPVFFEREESVSEILDAWNSMPATKGYDKADVETKILLAKELEKISDNKPLILDYVTMPFDENSTDVCELWRDLFEAEISGHIPDFDKFYKRYDPGRYKPVSSSTQILEKMYKLYDLLYVFCNRRGRHIDMQFITNRKADISNKLILILEKTGYESKTCRICGRKIAWMSPYKICHRCYISSYDEFLA